MPLLVVPPNVQSIASSAGVEASAGAAAEQATEPSRPESTETEPWTWEQAVALIPALAVDHNEGAPSPEVYERFAAWFTGKGSRTLYLRYVERCWPVRGSVDRGFSYRRTVTTTGNTRTRTGHTLMIEPDGITELGRGGTTYERDSKGQWQESGGFGTGCMEVLEPRSMSKVKRGVAYFGGYSYTLTAECREELREEQRCEDGSIRTCQRCTGVYLQRHASGRGWGRNLPRLIKRAHPSEVQDCSQPCPADEWTPRLKPLTRAIRDRRFYDQDTKPEGVLFLRKEDCQRVVQRLKK